MPHHIAIQTASLLSMKACKWVARSPGRLIRNWLLDLHLVNLYPTSSPTETVKLGIAIVAHCGVLCEHSIALQALLPGAWCIDQPGADASGGDIVS